MKIAVMRCLLLVIWLLVGTATAVATPGKLLEAIATEGAPAGAKAWRSR